MLDWYRFFMLSRLRAHLMIWAMPCSYVAGISLGVMFGRQILLLSLMCVSLFWAFVYAVLSLREKNIQRAQCHKLQQIENDLTKQFLIIGILFYGDKLIAGLSSKLRQRENHGL